MQSPRTPKISHAAAPALVLAIALAACGQLTGLSDDHLFDLVDGGPADGATDGPKSDGGANDAADGARSDAANSCSATAVISAEQRLSSFNGTQTCKTCLATACCVDVETCSKTSDCRNYLSCELDCTTKQQGGGERMQCFNRCTGNSVPATYATTIGTCAPQACKQECGFQ